jgi:hypothetical protein
MTLERLITTEALSIHHQEAVMQHALHRPQHQKIAALIAALAISAAGAVAIAHNTDAINGNDPAVAASKEPTGGNSPTPYGGRHPGPSEPIGASTPQPAGGARP